MILEKCYKKRVHKMIYINIKNGKEIETVDEFKTYKEAKEMLKEYKLGDRYNYYYLSQKSTKEWRNK